MSWIFLDSPREIQFIFVYFFIGGFSSIADIIGKESENLFDDESRFIGTWDNIDVNSEYPMADEIVFGSDGSFYPGFSNGFSTTWSLNDDVLEIKSGSSVLNSYNYVFSNDDTGLTLVDVDSEASFTYLKEEI